MPDAASTFDYCHLFQTLPGLYIVVHPDMTVAAVSDEYLRATKVKRENLIGHNLFEAFPENPDDPEAHGTINIRGSLERVFQTGKSDTLPIQKYDIQRPAAEGGGYEERYWKLTTFPTLDPARTGSVIYAVHHVEDITEQIKLEGKNAERKKINAALEIRTAQIEAERKLAAEALQDAQLRLESALNAGEIGTWTWNVPNDSVVADENLARFFSVSKEDAAGGKIEKYLAAMHPDDREWVGQTIAEALESQDSYEAEYRLINAAGGIRWVVARGRILRDETGKAFQLPGVVIDITERKQAENNLRESERRLKFALDAGRLGSYELDLATGEMICSERCLGNFGLPPDADLSFDKFISMIHPNDRPRVKQAVEEAAENHTDYEVEYKITRADGQSAWIFARGRCLYDEQGTALVMNGVTLDITNRKKSEEELRESRARLALALQAGRAGNFEWDIKNNVNIWSPELEELYGVPVGTFEGNFEAWSQRVVSEDAKLVEAGIRVALERKEKNYDYEFRVILPDGSHRWFAGRSRFEYDAEGQPLRMIGINVDIDDEKLAEELLLERTKLATLSSDIGIALNRREDLQSLLQHCTDAMVEHLDVAFARIWTLDKDGSVLELQASSGLYTHLDGSHSRVPVGQYKIGRIAAERKAHLSNEVWCDSEVGDKEWATRERMVAFAGYPLIVEDKLVGVMCVFARQPLTETITQTMESFANAIANAIDRKQIEKSLRISDERFQLVTRATNDAIWDWNLQTNEVWWNNAIQGMFGYSALQIEPTSQWWYEHIHPEDRERVVSGIHAVIDGGGENWADEYRFLCADGSYKYVFDRGFAIHRDGTALRMLGAMQDITDRKHIESEREYLLSGEKTARAEAEQANRLKDEFLATLSHELRTPLSSILGWSRLLREGRIDGEEAKQRALDTIERNAKSQSQLIEDILDVSRIISGKLRLDVRPVELASIIEMAIDSVRPAAEAKGIRLQRVIDADAMISGDADRLQQIVWNLISNAIKFTPKDGRVQIKLERVNSHVEIIIADNGIGIDTETLPFVFERFRQSDSSTTRKHGGLGLGLAIVRHLVELHGGTVYASSEGLNHGSTFTIMFPIIALRSKEVAYEEQKNVERIHPTADGEIAFTCPPEIKGLRILIVDDEADMREMLTFIFESCESEVKSASSVARALEIIKAGKFDVLISDLGMPERDGYDLIKNIRRLAPEHNGRIPAVALTAYARVEDRMQVLSAGFQMHVSKPVEPVELLAVVASLVSRNTHK